MKPSMHIPRKAQNRRNWFVAILASLAFIVTTSAYGIAQAPAYATAADADAYCPVGDTAVLHLASPENPDLDRALPADELQEMELDNAEGDDAAAETSAGGGLTVQLTAIATLATGPFFVASDAYKPCCFVASLRARGPPLGER